MTDERRTERTWALVDSADADGNLHGAWREVETPVPLSHAHRQRGREYYWSRTRRGISLRDIAQATGLTIAQVSDIEHGYCDATEEQWEQMWALVEGQ